MIKPTPEVPIEQAIVSSPCIGNCCLDPDDICLGCQRHIDEITGWHHADVTERRAILLRCQERCKLRAR
ncbi:DUF1289 domain-containing protein [Alteromonas gilva]|uniref:DUF1289 domain-containing protein n=1 Tax=Alteromonas gilva TaxID=2987522 RepID=A0ABT5L7M3_9ALTE|nr:DUF1289 domain-containing protein [Alteromonas gilva]MDC8831758.1 DUF1289 domain-containing protein [Alteromonas gilva]